MPIAVATDDFTNGGKPKRPSFRARYTSEPEECVVRRSTRSAGRKTKTLIASAAVRQGELRKEVRGTNLASDTVTTLVSRPAVPQTGRPTLAKAAAAVTRRGRGWSSRF